MGHRRGFRGTPRGRSWEGADATECECRNNRAAAVALKPGGQGDRFPRTCWEGGMAGTLGLSTVTPFCVVGLGRTLSTRKPNSPLFPCRLETASGHLLGCSPRVLLFCRVHLCSRIDFVPFCVSPHSTGDTFPQRWCQPPLQARGSQWAGARTRPVPRQTWEGGSGPAGTPSRRPLWAGSLPPRTGPQPTHGAA